MFPFSWPPLLCQEETYLLELVRYIHLNPLRAGIVSDLNALSGYAYCGHSRIIGKESSDWQDVDKVLGGNWDILCFHAFGIRGSFMRSAFTRHGYEGR